MRKNKTLKIRLSYHSSLLVTLFVILTYDEDQKKWCCVLQLSWLSYLPYVSLNSLFLVLNKYIFKEVITICHIFI